MQKLVDRFKNPWRHFGADAAEINECLVSLLHSFNRNKPFLKKGHELGRYVQRVFDLLLL